MSSIKVSELPAASQPFNGSEYVLGTQNGNSVKIPASTGGITPYATVGDIPTPYTGVAKVGHSLYTGNGDVPLEIPSLNSNNELIANIVPRTDTLANLLTIIGSAGELASATDQAAIVKFNGTTAGGDVFYSGVPLNKSGSILSFNLYNITTGSSTYQARMFDFHVGYDDANPMIVLNREIAGNGIKLSLDGVHYSTVTLPDSTYIYSGFITSTGTNIVIIPINSSVATTAYILSGPAINTSGNWTTAGTLPTTTSGFGRPVVCGNNSAVSLSADHTTAILINNTGAITDLTTFSTTSRIYDGLMGLPNHEWNIFAIAVSSTSSNVMAYLSYSTGNVLTWTEITLPTSNTIASGMYGVSSKYVIVGQYIAPIIRTAFSSSGISYSLGTFTLHNLGTLSASSKLTSTPNGFYLLGTYSGITGVYFTVDGITVSLVHQLLSGIGTLSGIFPSKDGVFVPVLDRGSATTTSLYFVNQYGSSRIKSSGYNNAFWTGLQYQAKAYNNSLTLRSLSSSNTSTITISPNQPNTQYSYDTTLQAATEGGTFQLMFSENKYTIFNAAALTAYNIVLPPYAFNGMEVTLMFTQPITTLTVTCNAGSTQPTAPTQTIMGVASYSLAIAQYQTVKFVLNQSINWVKV